MTATRPRARPTMSMLSMAIVRSPGLRAQSVEPDPSMPALTREGTNTSVRGNAPCFVARCAPSRYRRRARRCLGAVVNPRGFSGVSESRPPSDGRMRADDARFAPLPGSAWNHATMFLTVRRFRARCST